MKKFKEWPEWAQLLLCIGLPLVLIAIGCGVFFGGGYFDEISGNAKKINFTYTFDADFEGYHEGTTVSVRKDGLEILTAPFGDDSCTIDEGNAGYIYFKNKKPKSVEGFDASGVKIIPAGSIAPDGSIDWDNSRTYIPTQKYNPDNIYAIHLDKYM